MKTYQYKRKNWFLLFLSASVISLMLVLLAGCGGGGGSSDSVISDTGTISGTAVKGPVANAAITAFSINADGTKDKPIGTGHTDEQGHFSVSVNDHSGPVLMEMTGGHYIDEATGTDMNMFQGDIMTSAIPFMPAGSTMNNIQITPLTSMAQNMAQNMSGHMTETNITSANNATGHYFDVNDILHVHPIDTTVDGSGIGADQNMMNYGITIAAMSQYALEAGMSHSSGFVTNMMDDASDGHMDGMIGESRILMGGGMTGGMMMPADTGAGGMADAMEGFIMSPMNRSGVTLHDMRDLIDKLHTSDGILQ